MESAGLFLHPGGGGGNHQQPGAFPRFTEHDHEDTSASDFGIHGNPIAVRAIRVFITLAVAAVLFVIINFAVRPVKVPCATEEDCRAARQTATILAAVCALLNLIVGLGTLVAVLACAGINLTAVFATVGLLALIIGFGAQESIKSMIAGLSFALCDVFALGDIVTMAVHGDKQPVSGIVKQFGLQSTTLRTGDGASVYVTNSQIVTVVNHSQQPQRAEVDVKVPLAVDMDTALTALETLADELTIDPEMKGKLVGVVTVRGVTELDAPHTFTIRMSARVFPKFKKESQHILRLAAAKRIQSLMGDAVSKRG